MPTLPPYNGTYTCGCEYDWDGATYQHYVKPGCRFDGRKVGGEIVRGYLLVNWDVPRRSILAQTGPRG